MPHRSTQGQPRAIGTVQPRWQWLLMAALLATIPAFYLELLDAEARWGAGAVYLLAALILLAARWHQWHLHADQGGHHLELDALLVPGLLVSALLPPSVESQVALIWRMVVSGGTLACLVVLLRPWLKRGSLRHVLTLSLSVMGACGLGFWWLEPSTKTLADGLWLAFTTAATVGYGDVVPTTTASKIFAVFVVLIGYAALSLVTAAVAASWVQTSEKQMERDILHELHREVRELRRELAQLRELVQPPDADADAAQAHGVRRSERHPE
ncbi:potassium channel family protein [Pseudorhodoferax sp.]|jgi:voltage-gated potassium channel|uniref:potassium channel family protein n=1 Tax=Pseudorhodoferax sp. TaxID=1993553 RepID=UPI002DD66983|nr:potassium channel family protein [Pseudorhodoferax sp.]